MSVRKRQRTGRMVDLSISPFIAPHAEELCHTLALYGGAVVDADGRFQSAVTYQYKEGVHLPRIVHVQRVDTRESMLFILDEVTGEYMSHERTLWPLAPSSLTCLPQVYRRLGTDLTLLVEQFLTDILPIRRPPQADAWHLRRQVMHGTDLPQEWVTYWQTADVLQRKRGPTKRSRPNRWVGKTSTPLYNLVASA
jgi:hypothetical protein